MLRHFERNVCMADVESRNLSTDPPQLRDSANRDLRPLRRNDVMLKYYSGKKSNQVPG